MLLGELTEATITKAPLFRVTARNVVLEVKLNDSSVKENSWEQTCSKRTNEVSAYSFDDSTKAFTNVRMNITEHKARSATIDCLGIHLDNMLNHGQLYVAMSRVRNSEDLYFFGADLPQSIKRKYGVNCDAIEIIRKRIR